MPDTKISNLTAGTTPLAGTEQVPIVQGGATVRVPASAFIGSGGMPAHPGYAASRWYLGFPGQITSGGVVNVNQIVLQPFYIAQTVTLSDLAARVGTAVAASNFQLAIYAMNATTKLPTGNPLAATGNLSGATAAWASGAITGGNVQLQPGWYWAALNANAAIGFMCMPNPTIWASHLIGSTVLNEIAESASRATYALTFAQTFGTWPSLTGATFGTVLLGNTFVPTYRVASVP